MLKSYLRHLYRDRRRFVLSATLILVATFFAPQSLPDPVPFIPSEALVIAALFLAMPFVAIYARNQRHVIEVMAVANLIFALVGWVFPESVGNLATPDPDYLRSTAFYGALLIASYYFLYGKWADRFTPHRTFTVRTRLTSCVDLQSLWYGLITVPGHLDRYADPEVVSADYVDPAHRVIRMLYWQPGRRGEWLLFIDEIEKFRRIKMRMRVVEGVFDKASQGVTEFRFSDHGKYRSVTMTFDADAIAPRRMLRHWLDDTVGRMMDSRIAAIEYNVSHPGERCKPISYDEWWEDTTEVSKSLRPGLFGFRTAHDRELTEAESSTLASITASSSSGEAGKQRRRKKAA